MTADETELIKRARVIVAYSGKDQGKLATAAKLKPSDLKAWFDRTKTKHPPIEELVLLAQAAGIPPRFAERGFEDLMEEDDHLDEMRKRLDALEATVRDLADAVVSAAEASRQTDASDRTSTRPQTQPPQ